MQTTRDHECGRNHWPAAPHDPHAKWSATWGPIEQPLSSRFHVHGQFYTAVRHRVWTIGSAHLIADCCVFKGKHWAPWIWLIWYNRCFNNSSPDNQSWLVAAIKCIPSTMWGECPRIWDGFWFSSHINWIHIWEVNLFANHRLSNYWSIRLLLICNIQVIIHFWRVFFCDP